MSRIDALRTELGGPHPLAATKVKDFLEPYVRAFIEHAPFAVMSSSNANGDCDASPKGGLPGFIKVIDDRTLLIPDAGGNRLFQSYQNFESNAKAGLLFMIPGMDVTVRVNGRVRVVEPAQLDGTWHRAGTTQSRRQCRADSGLDAPHRRSVFPLPALVSVRRAVGHRHDHGQPRTVDQGFEGVRRASPPARLERRASFRRRQRVRVLQQKR